MTNEKELRQKLDDIFEDMNSYTGEKLAEDELFDRVLELFLSHTKEVVEKILPKVQKFIDKVESGKAKSVETYADMKEIRDFLASLEDNKK